MIGAVIQITAKNSQDSILTGKPVFNFIKQVYKQYDNFALEETKILPNEPLDFGKNITFTILNLGDLLHKLYFCFTLPALVPTSGTYAAWTNSIGHAIIDTIDITINDTIYVRQHGLYMEINNELSKETDDPDNKLIGKYLHTSMLQYNAIESSEYKVPLVYWFTENIGASLPLYKLQNSKIEIKLKLKPFSECIIYDGLTPPSISKVENSFLSAQYIFVNDSFKLKNQGTETFIFEELQYSNPSNVSKTDLTFNHQCKELIFVLREIASEQNNDHFNFSVRNSSVFTPVRPILDSAKLILDTKDREDFKSSSELSILNNSRYHNGSNKHIYTMPFCSEPAKWIPTGSLNFSAFTHVVLYLKLINAFPPCKLYIFARTYNWITIENGFASISYNV